MLLRTGEMATYHPTMSNPKHVSPLVSLLAIGLTIGGVWYFFGNHKTPTQTVMGASTAANGSAASPAPPNTMPLAAPTDSTVDEKPTAAGVARARQLQTKATGVTTYARSITASPRQSAYNHATTVEGMAEEIARGNPCITRLQKDFRQIEVLRTEVATAKQSMPSWGYYDILDDALVDAKLCVDCSDNRKPCQSMITQLKSADDELRLQEKATR